MTTADPLRHLARQWGRSAAVGVHRPLSVRVRVLVPHQPRTGLWLRRVCGPGTRPEYDPDDRVWTVARPHFRAVAEALAVQFGSCHVWLDLSRRHQCDTRCQEAVGDECECQCGGDQHGGAD